MQRPGLQQVLISIHALLAESDSASWKLLAMHTLISIHALLAESDSTELTFPGFGIISIHALLAESDSTQRTYQQGEKISIHALLAESDSFSAGRESDTEEFLSTLSLRRATSMRTSLFCGCFDFYPRSPCGERPWQRGSRITYVEFLSTLSLRRATKEVNNGRFR